MMNGFDQFTKETRRALFPEQMKPALFRLLAGSAEANAILY